MWVCAPVCWDQRWLLSELNLAVVVSHLIWCWEWNLGPLGKQYMLLTDVPTFQSLMYFLILISILCAKDLQFLPLACLFFEVLALVITAVKQLWFLPEDKLAARIKWQVFWPWVGMKTVGEGCKVYCAAFSPWDVQWKRQCQERPLFVTETWVETALDLYILPSFTWISFFAPSP